MSISRLLRGLVFVLVFSAAAPPASAASPPPSMAVPVVFADSVSFRGFVKYWKGFINRTDRVVLVVALVMAAALFIITRGKWLK